MALLTQGQFLVKGQYGSILTNELQYQHASVLVTRSGKVETGSKLVLCHCEESKAFHSTFSLQSKLNGHKSRGLDAAEDHLGMCGKNLFFMRSNLSVQQAPRVQRS
jgi:hypothetical protein